MSFPASAENTTTGLQTPWRRDRRNTIMQLTSRRFDVRFILRVGQQVGIEEHALKLQVVNAKD